MAGIIGDCYMTDFASPAFIKGYRELFRLKAGQLGFTRCGTSLASHCRFINMTGKILNLIPDKGK
jgi:hypothetical protein